MQKLETRNGTLVFVRVPENKTIENILSGKYEKLGEVTKEGITFDCEPFVEYTYSKRNQKLFIDYKWTSDVVCFKDNKKSFMSLMKSQGIELTEGNKFVVLKERK